MPEPGVSPHPEPPRTYPIIFEPSPLAFHGDLLVELTATELRFWDSLINQRIDTITVPYRAFCFLQDGTIAALTQPPGKSYELHHIDTNRRIDVLHGSVSLLDDRTAVLPAASPTEVYQTGYAYGVHRLHLGKYTVDRIELLEIGRTDERLDQVASLADGRLLALKGTTLYVVQPEHPVLRHELLHQDPGHLSSTTGGRFWYSYAAELDNTRWLALGRVTDQVVIDLSLQLPGTSVIHLAAGGGAAVALMIRHPTPGHNEFTLVVVNESGTVRWSRDLPVEFPIGWEPFVAISQHRVVLRGALGQLVYWNAVTGEQIG